MRDEADDAGWWTRDRVRSRDLEALRRRATDDPEFIRAVDDQGDTPLSVAIQFRSVAGVRLLLDLGADPSGPQEGAGYTCLMSAVEAWGHDARESDMKEIVQMLVEHGAEPDEPHPIDGDTALHLAALLGRSAAVRALVELGARIDSVDTKCGETPLMHAADAGEVDAVKTLISLGADVNFRSRDPESTPLLEAASSGHLAVVRVLIDAGADVRARDESGESALDLASSSGVADAGEVVRILREAGAET